MKTKKLATQLILSFLVAMVFPMTIATIFSIVYFHNEIRDHAIQKIKIEGKAAELMFNNTLSNVRQLAEIYARRNDVALLLSYDVLGDSFQNDLFHSIQTDHVDMLLIVDSSRKVARRIHAAEHLGDTLTESPYLVNALSGKSSVAVEIFSHDRMRSEGFHFPKTAAKNRLVMMSAAAPVYDRKRHSIIGAVIVRKHLEPNGPLIQAISQKLSVNTGFYQGIFYIGAVLFNESSAFHPVPENIARKAIASNIHESYTEFYQNGHISLCIPIVNFYQHPVAMIVIQHPVFPYIRAQNVAIITHVIILFLAIILGLFFRKRIERHILTPLQQLQNGVKQIREGDYKYRLSVKGMEEIENLAHAFNEMTVELQDKQDFLTRTEKKYRGIFENAVEGIFQMTPDGRFLDVNPAMARILGHGSQAELMAEITDLARQSFVRPDDLSEFRHILAEKLQIIDFETQLYQKGGHIIWCSISARAVFDTEGEVLIKGDLLYYEGTLLDITNRKERERAEQARNTAELANQAKTDFLARMSHEIRTPMNAILGMAEMLQNSSLSSEQKRYVDLFSSSGELLLNIINDILDFSKIEANQLSIETIVFDIIDVIENIGKILSFKAHEKTLELIIHIDPDIPRFVIGDPVRVQQILINLTGNAIKFTEKGEVVLRVSRERKQIDSYLFTVADTGIGIDSSYHSTIFDSFSQADTSITRHYGGTGLGLAISKKLVELMNGSIWFASEKRKGTTFSFDLPLKPVDRPDDPATRALQKYLGKNVIIVEKSLQSAHALAARLKYWHIHVDVFDSGPKVLNHIRREPVRPEIIFINHQLIDSNPFELQKQIIASLPEPPLFIILFPSNTSIEKKEQAKTNGFDAFLNKPFMINDLDRSVDISTHKKRPEKRDILPVKPASLDTNNPVSILVADDHVSNRKVIEMFLKNDPVVMDFAENGQVAVEKFKSSVFDIIFMDMEMPVLNGLKATRTIREIEANQEQEAIPIIFLTAHALDEHRNQCFDAGGTACLIKPVKYQKLIQTIQEYAPATKIDDTENNDPDFSSFESDFNDESETDFIGLDESETDFIGLDESDLMDDMPDFADVDIQTSMDELIPFFIESTTNDLEQIQAAMKTEDLETVRRIGHSLKGSSGAYGQDGIGKIGADIEEAALNGNREITEEKILELSQALGILKK